MNIIKEYLPKHKELVWGWDAGEEATRTLCDFDYKTKALLAIMEIKGVKHYAPYNDIPPPNISADRLAD